MTRSPTLRPIRQPSNAGDLCASLKRIAFTAAAGFSALFLASILFWK